MKPVIKLPEGLVPIAYPGYFWHIAEEYLYSIKVAGELRKLKLRGFYKNQYITLKPGYDISHQGKRVRLPLEYLRSLGPLTTDHVIKYK